MNPSQKELKLKKCREINERINELHRLIGRAPYQPLKNKIFAGHWRFFKVRDDVLRSSIGLQVQTVVDACNTWILGRKKDSKSYENCYSAVYCKYAGCTYVSKQHLRPLHEWEMDKLTIPIGRESFIRKWFDVEEKTKSYGSKNVTIRTYYPKVPSHMIEFKYKAAYIKEEKTKLSDCESELAKCYQFMERNNGWNVLYTNHRDEWDLNLEKRKVQNNLHKKEIDEYYASKDED